MRNAQKTFRSGAYVVEIDGEKSQIEKGLHFDIKVINARFCLLNKAKDGRGEKLTITLEKNLDYMLGLRSETEATGWDFAQGRGGGGRGG